MPYSYSRKLGPRRKPRMPRKRMPVVPWYNRKYSPGDIASKAWAMAKYLKSIVNVEHHKVDFPISATGSVGTTPVITNLTAIATGDTEGTRTANSILLRYLYMKQTVRLNASSNYARVRVVVVRDKQQVGDTAPAWLDVYESTSPIALLNKNTVGRFDILFDKCYDLDANNAQFVVDKYIRLQSHARYNGSASTDIQKGGIYYMYVGDDNTNQQSLTANLRMCYVDN